MAIFEVTLKPLAHLILWASCVSALGCSQPSAPNPPVVEATKSDAALVDETARLRRDLADASARFERCKERRAKNIKLLDDLDATQSETRIAFARRSDLVESGEFEIQELRFARSRQEIVESMEKSDLDGCGSP